MKANIWRFWQPESPINFDQIAGSVCNADFFRVVITDETGSQTTLDFATQSGRIRLESLSLGDWVEGSPNGSPCRYRLRQSIHKVLAAVRERETSGVRIKVMTYL